MESTVFPISCVSQVTCILILGLLVYGRDGRLHGQGHLPRGSRHLRILCYAGLIGSLVWFLNIAAGSSPIGTLRGGQSEPPPSTQDAASNKPSTDAKLPTTSQQAQQDPQTLPEQQALGAQQGPPFASPVDTGGSICRVAQPQIIYWCSNCGTLDTKPITDHGPPRPGQAGGALPADGATITPGPGGPQADGGNLASAPLGGSLAADGGTGKPENQKEIKSVDGEVKAPGREGGKAEETLPATGRMAQDKELPPTEDDGGSRVNRTSQAQKKGERDEERPALEMTKAPPAKNPPTDDKAAAPRMNKEMKSSTEEPPGNEKGSENVCKQQDQKRGMKESMEVPGEQGRPCVDQEEPKEPEVTVVLKYLYVPGYCYTGRTAEGDKCLQNSSDYEWVVAGLLAEDFGQQPDSKEKSELSPDLKAQKHELSEKYRSQEFADLRRKLESKWPKLIESDTEPPADLFYSQTSGLSVINLTTLKDYVAKVLSLSDEIDLNYEVNVDPIHILALKVGFLARSVQNHGKPRLYCRDSKDPEATAKILIGMGLCFTKTFEPKDCPRRDSCPERVYYIPRTPPPRGSKY